MSAALSVARWRADSERPPPGRRRVVIGPPSPAPAVYCDPPPPARLRTPPLTGPHPWTGWSWESSPLGHRVPPARACGQGAKRTGLQQGLTGGAERRPAGPRRLPSPLFQVSHQATLAAAGLRRAWARAFAWHERTPPPMRFPPPCRIRPSR
jgi:hypothetical protein